MAYLFLLAPSTQVKRLYSRNEKEQERLQDCSLLSVFEISFWSVIKMIKRWAAGEMAPWSLDHPAPSYPPQQCMHGEDAGGYQSPVGQLAGTARSRSGGNPAWKIWWKCIEEDFPCWPLTSTGSPLSGHHSTHIPPHVYSQMTQI